VRRREHVVLPGPSPAISRSRSSCGTATTWTPRLSRGPTATTSRARPSPRWHRTAAGDLGSRLRLGDHVRGLGADAEEIRDSFGRHPVRV